MVKWKHYLTALFNTTHQVKLLTYFIDPLGAGPHKKALLKDYGDYVML